MSDPEARRNAHHALAKSKEDLLRKRRFEEQLAEADRTLKSQRAHVAELEAVWRRESADVQRLTGLSVIGLFTSLLGSKEQRLKKEQQELAAASLKLDAARETAEVLEGECDALAYEVKGLEGAQRAYDAAMAAKEVLLQTDGEHGRLLATLAEEEAAAREHARELREAVNSGTEAERCLAWTVESLQSASNFGTWDMLGGGWIATAMKHSRLDDAKAAATRAQSALLQFKREMADVGQDVVTSIDIGDFSRFADYFFDGLIMDWSVQSKISSARSRAEEAHRRVESLVWTLKHDLDQQRLREADLESKRRDLIERA